MNYRPKSDRKLGEEHVIAEGLGGNLVLQEASCEACEAAIKTFEPVILKTILYAPRVHLGIRRKRRRRGEEAIKVQGHKLPGGEEIEIHLPIKNIPVLLFLPRLLPPGVLVGRPRDLTHMSGVWCIHLNNEKPIVPPGFKSFASPVLDTFRFSQFLAKIAHGFAVDAFGETFNPVLPDFIRNVARDPRYDLVGSSEGDAPSDNLHELSADWRVENGITFATVKIRLFANLGAPTYLVVAGTSKAR